MSYQCKGHYKIYINRLSLYIRKITWGGGHFFVYFAEKYLKSLKGIIQKNLANRNFICLKYIVGYGFKQIVKDIQDVVINDMSI